MNRAGAWARSRRDRSRATMAFHVDSGGVEAPDARVFLGAPDQWKLGASEDEAVDAVLRFHPLDDPEQPDSSRREERSLDQLVDVLVVDVRLRRGFGAYDLNGGGFERLRMEEASRRGTGHDMRGIGRQCGEVEMASGGAPPEDRVR